MSPMSMQSLRSILCQTAATAAAALPAAAAAQNHPALQTLGAGPPAYVHEVWTVADGLPVNSLNGVVQGQDGYVWAATFDGLVRFDGVRFTVYSTGTHPGLPSNRIVEMWEASDGSLWLITEQNHLVRFRDDRFTHFGPQHGIADNAATVVYEEADGTVWVGTQAGFGWIVWSRRSPTPRIASARFTRSRSMPVTPSGSRPIVAPTALWTAASSASLRAGTPLPSSKPR
jgi:ligand-binding sensor domain-containing protein